MRHPARLSTSPRLWLLGLALLPLPIGNASAGGASHAAVRPTTGRAPVTCEATVQHPIQVRIAALDPIRRGATVRLRLTTSSVIGLSESEARIVSPGGATVLGRSRATLGRMGPQREASTDFAVAVPAEGKRFLIEFRVEEIGRASCRERVWIPV